jgi:hypothetical protein
MTTSFGGKRAQNTTDRTVMAQTSVKQCSVPVAERIDTRLWRADSAAAKYAHQPQQCRQLFTKRSSARTKQHSNAGQ